MPKSLTMRVNVRSEVICHYRPGICFVGTYPQDKRCCFRSSLAILPAYYRLHMPFRISANTFLFFIKVVSCNLEQSLAELGVFR